MSRRPWPLVRVLLAWSATVVALTLVLASALVLVSESRFLAREVRRRGETLGQALAALAVGPAPAAAGDLAVSRAPDLLAASVSAQDGSVLWRFGPSEEEVRAAGSGGLKVVEREVRVLDTATGTVAPVRVRLLLSTGRLRLHLLETGLKMVFSLGAGLALLLLLGVAAADRLAAPVVRLAQWARSYRAGGGSETPPRGGTREVRELAEAFGELIGRLEREQAEAWLNRTLRAESVAMLASGVAHDFNNLLAAVELHLRLLANDPAGAEDSVAAIRELVTRGREVVEQLLDEARDGETERRPVDLDGLLARSESFLRFLLEPAAVVHVERPGVPVTVCGAEPALRRVLLNLAVNARRVLEGRAGAEVWVRLTRGPQVAEVVVEDNGPGLPPGDPEALFQPRVSGGSGHGLGLAVVAALVAEHGGAIRASAAPGGGARFTVTIPLAGPGGCEERADTVP